MALGVCLQSICAYKVEYGPSHNKLGWLQREKTFLRGFRQSEIQTCLLRYRDYLENLNFTRSKSRYDTLQYPNNKGTDQTARMRRLVCTFAFANPPRWVVFLQTLKDGYSRVEAHIRYPFLSKADSHGLL